MTYAVMLGCEMPSAPTGKAWTEGECDETSEEYAEVPWIFEKFKWGRGPKLDADEANGVLGLFVACGASGKDGVPDLEVPFALDVFEKAKPYVKVCATARKQWERLTDFAAKQGTTLPEPRLFLVEAEVA